MNKYNYVAIIRVMFQDYDEKLEIARLGKEKLCRARTRPVSPDTSRVPRTEEFLKMIFFITCPIPIFPSAISLDMMKNEMCKS